MTTATSRASLDSKIYSICDIMRRSNASGVLQYVPELTWMLFLRIQGECEELEAMESEAVGIPFTPSLSYPYRWRDCAGYSRWEFGGKPQHSKWV